MDIKDEALLKRLFDTFKAEAAEHLLKISSGLVELERAADPEACQGIVEVIFREAHSFKGAAGSLNLGGIESVCQAIEGLFAALKRLEIRPSQALFDILHRAIDILDRLSNSPESDRKAEDRIAVREILRELEEIVPGRRPGGAAGSEYRMEPGPRGTDQTAELSGERHVSEPSEDKITAAGKGTPPPAMIDTVRISAKRLDSIMLQAEEFIPEKLSARERLSEIEELRQLLLPWTKRRPSIAPSITKLRAALNGNQDLVISREMRLHASKIADALEECDLLLMSLEQKIAALESSSKADLRSFSSKMEELLTDAKKALMLPLHSLVEILPKVVRDLSHAQGKRAELIIKGADLEIDRRILEEIKDPLNHLVRNCIDHGIERPEERRSFNKPEAGSILIEAKPGEGGEVAIVVADDGRGIDSDRLKASALGTKVISQAEAAAMSEAEALNLAFLSGVSTSPIITDLSGRGLGLAIVSEKVQRLGGRISIDSTPGRGTTFTVTLPATLATFRGILVRVCEHFFVIPGASVERVLRLKADRIGTVENRETIGLDGHTLALVRLDRLLGIVRTAFKEPSPGKVHILVLKAGETRTALAVDEIISEQEVLLKNLGSQLARVKCVSGATLTGTGRVVPVLNPGDLIKMALKMPVEAVKSTEEAGENGGVRKTLLVVEDSITARALLKSILEAAGYEVKTAVDGLDAYALLKTAPVDLVVSDVDMPKMNGLDLTARIRGDKNLSELPVVLVTALSSAEDRERGIDAGANAYIVKSSFDQSNLLEVIRRLV